MAHILKDVMQLEMCSGEECATKVLCMLFELNVFLDAINLLNNTCVCNPQSHMLDGLGIESVFIYIVAIVVFATNVVPHLFSRTGLKYDLKRVEEVLYDVKIRGLLKAKQEQPSVPTEMEA